MSNFKLVLLRLSRFLWSMCRWSSVCVVSRRFLFYISGIHIFLCKSLGVQTLAVSVKSNFYFLDCICKLFDVSMNKFSTFNESLYFSYYFRSVITRIIVVVVDFVFVVVVFPTQIVWLDLLISLLLNTSFSMQFFLSPLNHLCLLSKSSVLSSFPLMILYNRQFLLRMCLTFQFSNGET